MRAAAGIPQLPAGPHRGPLRHGRAVREGAGPYARRLPGADGRGGARRAQAALARARMTVRLRRHESKQPASEGDGGRVDGPQPGGAGGGHLAAGGADLRAASARPGGRVLDVGCGTGEITARLAERFPDATLRRHRPGGVAPRPRTRAHARNSATASASSATTPWRYLSATASSTWRLPARAAGGARRRAACSRDDARAPPRRAAAPHRRGLRHAVVPPHRARRRRLLAGLPPRYGAAVGCDLHVGRKMFTLLHDLGMTRHRASTTWSSIPCACRARSSPASGRPGATATPTPSSSTSSVPREEVERRWREMIGCIRDPRGYALWQVPVWTAQK